MATTWVPQYSTVTTAIVARGGTEHVDIGVAADRGGNALLARDAHGGLGLVRGTDRILARVIRALLTPLGTNAFDATYGSAALPGLSATSQVTVQVANVVLREARRVGQSRLSPAERVVRVEARASALPADPRQLLVSVLLWTADGSRTPSQFTIPA